MVPKAPKSALYKGTWLHALQEAHHRAWAVDSGFKPKDVYPKGEVETWPEVHARFEEEYENLFEEEQEDLDFTPRDIKRLFRAYLRHWSSGDIQNYSVARLRDGTPAIEFVVVATLPTRITRAPFKGRIDLVVEDHEYGGTWIWDSKWVKTVPIADERMMSPQSLMYPWAMNQDGYDLRGFLYNYGRNKVPAEPQVLKKGLLTTRQRLDTDYATYLTAIKDLHGDQWRDYVQAYYIDKLRDLKDRERFWFDRQRIPVEPDRVEHALDEFLVTVSDIKARNKFAPPRSYFYNCKFQCSYHDICVAEFAGMDIEPLIEAKYTFEEERYGDREEQDLLAS